MDRNKMLERRAKTCCCRYCGGTLEVRMWIYNKFGGAGAELYCGNCNKIEFGTAPEIYNMAKDFIDANDFDYYFDLENNNEKYQMNIAKVCDILSWCSKEWGILDSSGFHLKGEEAL